MFNRFKILILIFLALLSEMKLEEEIASFIFISLAETMVAVIVHNYYLLHRKL